MRPFYLTLMLAAITLTGYSQIHTSCYFPGDTTVKKDIPQPGHYSGQRFGWWHFNHDQLVHYLDGLAEHSGRVSIQEYGRTHENRPLKLLAITSPENHQRLEQIRQAHLDYVHGRSDEYVDQDMPLIIWLGYGVHGNESSPGNASMLAAYYLAASRSQQVEDMLDQAVVLIDPVLNPDGFHRAANWSNMHMPRTQTYDYRHRQFREDWPGGRTNHYWFDLNRDWMPAQHPETRARLKLYHAWKPHVLTDHHEMGSNSTFFFQPGEPQRVNPRTPDENYDLTRRLARYHARALDRAGTLYFSEEGFDDFYYGKGSTYPDGNGSIGILFEQSRVMGQVLENDHGRQTFADAIRNHFTVSLSSIRGALDLRQELNDYQRRFFASVPQKVKQDQVKGWVFTAGHDPVRMHHFLELMNNHEIKVHRLSKDYRHQDKHFPAGSSYLVSSNQPQYRFVRSLFEKRTRFQDSIFYDVSAWTMPLAFDLDHAPLKQTRKVQELAAGVVDEPEPPKGSVVGQQSPVGYVVRGSYYNIHRIIYDLQESDLGVKVAARQMTATTSKGKVTFGPGSIFLPSRNQSQPPESIYRKAAGIAEKHGVDVFALETGWNRDGMDLGSRGLRPLEKPEILMVAGDGVSSYSAGEIWHLLDHRFRIPVVLIKPSQISRTNLFDFNTLILPDGYYRWGKNVRKNISMWLNAGNVLIAQEDANDWLSEHGMINLDTKDRPEPDSLAGYALPYNERANSRRAQSISGVILEASLDPTHPIAYGTDSSTMPVFKDNSEIYQSGGNPYNEPVKIVESPLISGYLSEENQKLLGNTPYCRVYDQGRGRVVSFLANPNFRGFWYGTNRLFMNALFYGDLM